MRQSDNLQKNPTYSVGGTFHIEEKRKKVSHKDRKCALAHSSKESIS